MDCEQIPPHPKSTQKGMAEMGRNTHLPGHGDLEQTSSHPWTFLSFFPYRGWAGYWMKPCPALSHQLESKDGDFQFLASFWNRDGAL